MHGRIRACMYWRMNWDKYVWNDASKKKFFFSSSVKWYKTNDSKRHGRNKKIHEKWFDWLSRAIYNNNLQYVLWSQYYVFDWMDREIPSSKRKYNIKWIQLYIKCIYIYTKQFLIMYSTKYWHLITKLRVLISCKSKNKICSWT